MVIGLTGRYCAGKNSLLPYLEGRGFQSIDVDALGHRSLEVNQAKLVTLFGAKILDGNGQVHRPTLGSLVFRDPISLGRLEGIVHPWMIEEVERTLSSDPSGNWVINAALLGPMRLDRLCDLVFFVQAPRLVRAMRGMKRDKLGFLSVLARIRSQKRIHPQRFSSKVDIYRVKNVGDIQKAQDQVALILDKIFQKP